MGSLGFWVSVSAVLFCIGVFGVLSQHNFLRVLISLELLLNAAALNFVAANRFLNPDEPAGSLFALFIIAIAACAAVIGLAVLLTFFRARGHLDLEGARMLRDRGTTGGSR